MGNGANLVIVENQDWDLYYDHWAGCRILDSLIGGPELALRYIRSQRQCEKTEWTDPIWADGGAVVDLDRRRLLFFGDELMVEMPERRALMAVLEQLWPGYAICWAFDGTVELAGYVGADLRPYAWDKQPPVELTRDRDALCHLVSVKDIAGGVRLWPLHWELSSAWRGPELLDALPGRGVKSLTLNKIPEGGVHIDLAEQMVGVWQTADTLGIFHELHDLWPGWHTECWEDRFEEQLKHCGAALRVPEVDLVAGIDSAQSWISKRVFQSFEDSPAGHIAQLAGLLGPLHPGMTVSHDALADCRTRPLPEEWTRFTAACDQLRVRRAKSA